MIAIGCDHGGVELKDSLVGYLRAKSVEVCDLGTQGRESVDYPDYGRASLRAGIRRPSRARCADLHQRYRHVHRR